MKAPMKSLLFVGLFLASSVSYAARTDTTAIKRLKKNLEVLIAEDPSILAGAIEHYLDTKPDSVYAALIKNQKNEQEKQKKASLDFIEQNFDDLFFSQQDGVSGPLEADTTLLVLSDRSCGFCRKAWQYLNEISANDPGLRVAYKEVPILGKGSQDAAKLAIWAQSQGRFKEMDVALNQVAPPLEADKLKKAMASMGIKEDLFNSHENLKNITNILQ